MPKSMTDDVANVIVHALQRGLSRKDIAGVVGVSRRAITRISTNLRLHGAPKAPPSGLKQGRPIKMTESQAHVSSFAASGAYLLPETYEVHKFWKPQGLEIETDPALQAMLGWIAGRNHTFFIKDLTQFLKDHHGFQGCDGTVRRALIRAGYQRKLPWHKSEITAWVPPSGPPNLSFVMHVNHSPQKVRAATRVAASANRSNATGRASEAALTPEEVHRLEAHAQPIQDGQSQHEQDYHMGHTSDIDPALEAATIPHPQTSFNSRPLPSQSFPPPPQSPLNGLGHSPPSRQSESTSALPTTPLQPHTAPLEVMSSSSQDASSHPNSAMISSLQMENARQRELIAQLQRQLAQGSPAAVPATAAAAAKVTSSAASAAAATATAAMQMQSHQQDEQDRQRACARSSEQGIIKAKAEKAGKVDQDTGRQVASDAVRRLQAMIDAHGSGDNNNNHDDHDEDEDELEEENDDYDDVV